MSYHGGLAGLVVAFILFTRKRKQMNTLQWTDIVSASVPLGYTFGRLGNFINGELYGRATASPFGVLFPNANRIPATEQWAREIAQKVGIPVEDQSQLLNLPRHPSQLYEAAFEGYCCGCFCGS